MQKNVLWDSKRESGCKENSLYEIIIHISYFLCNFLEFLILQRSILFLNIPRVVFSHFFAVAEEAVDGQWAPARKLYDRRNTTY